MRRIDHPLPGQSLGHQTQITSLHFGTAGARPKVYVQASLHAEEIPGMLTAHHLRGLLQKSEAEGRITGEIILVPVANPIGLAQRLDHKSMGRFELGTSENFNRHYPDLAEAVWPQVRDALGEDAAANVALVRAAATRHLAQWQPTTPLQGLRKVLSSLAHDADYVLDLHCDFEAVMHLYVEEPCWPALQALAHWLGAQAVLLARDSGGASFDECFSGLWWQLAARIAKEPALAGRTIPLPQACASTTVELRGEADVTHALASADAQAIHAWLQHAGVIAGAINGTGTTTPPTAPAPRCEATPLAGAQVLRAPTAGVLTYHAAAGATLAIGDPVADVIDPISGQVHVVRAEVDGVLYARFDERYVLAGDKLGNIAGKVAFRTGYLLSE